MTVPYGPGWASLRLPRTTPVNPALPHQVVFTLVRGGMAVAVSCNCRAGREPMGTSRNLEESRGFYNEPRNHAFPFGATTDRARW